MSDIVEFLRARYGDAKDQVRRDFPEQPQAHLGEISEATFRAEAEQRARRLADLDAKLAILDEHPATRDVIAEKPDGLHGFGCATCHQDEGMIIGYGWCRTLRLLAAPFAAHPDYDERWRP